MKRYFDILELKPGATPDEVKAAYRDLAKVWHPDRFEGDTGRLKDRAAEKLAEINEAYAKIRSYQARQKERIKAINESRQRSSPSQNGNGTRIFGERPGRPQADTPPPSRPKPPPSQAGDARTYASYMRSNAKRKNPYRTSQRPRNRRPGSPFASSASQARRPSPSSSGAKGHPKQRPTTTLSPETALMRHRSSLQKERYSRTRRRVQPRKRRRQSRTAIYITVGVLVILTIISATFFVQREQRRTETHTLLEQQQAGLIPGESTTPQETSAPRDAAAAAPVTREPAAARAKPGYFTLGSTRQEVIQVQGEPSHIRDRLFRYGLSSIFFENGRVIGWHQASNDRLKVQLPPSVPQNLEFFTVGSTQDEVLSVQGTPDQYRDSGREFKYGESRVMFERGLVVSWHQDKEAPLSARLLPRVRSNIPFFTLGSTRDDVLSVQGSPDYFTETTFHYGYSTVSFEEGTVTGWHGASTSPLKVELYPSKQMSVDCFTYNSTRDEVLAAQGTPTQFTDRMLKFGYSTVSFDEGRVVSWFESAASSPLKTCK